MLGKINSVKQRGSIMWAFIINLVSTSPAKVFG